MNMKYYNKNKKQFIKAQKTGDYRIFYFDLVGSRKIYANNPEELDNELPKLTEAVTNEILKLEKEKKKRIFHRHIELDIVKQQEGFDFKNKVVLCKKQRGLKITSFKKSLFNSDQINPYFGRGDEILFIVLNKSISKEKFYKIFEKERSINTPNYKFTSLSALYDTDEFKFVDTKLSRTYCIAILQELAALKKKNNKNKKVVKIKNRQN